MRQHEKRGISRIMWYSISSQVRNRGKKPRPEPGKPFRGYGLKIVITNDDGYGEPGLTALSKAVEPLGDVIQIAPKDGHSFCGHRVTMKSPIRVDHPEPHHYVVHGAPADCTRLALKMLTPDADWIIAGVNPGANLGTDVYQSGTVAAAREAAILGVRAIAVSQYVAAGTTIDWEATGWLTAEILQILMKKTIQTGQFWNVNLPSPIHAPTVPPHVICPLDKHPHDYRFAVDGHEYKYRGIIHDRPRSSGSDVDICFNGRISATLMEI